LVHFATVFFDGDYGKIQYARPMTSRLLDAIQRMTKVRVTDEESASATEPIE
jgi:hypothetical protein